jgi:hypothetical protein
VLTVPGPKLHENRILCPAAFITRTIRNFIFFFRHRS